MATTDFDFEPLRKLLAGPGMDTRQWISFGTVLPEKESPDNDPVEFSTDMGGSPIVLVKLHPSGVKIPCRVACGVAGNGEGEWHPFIEHDEVIVAIPEGDEAAGCTIIGRLNNDIDKFPSVVAGQDVNKNNFGFKRIRTPYVVEFASTFLQRSDTTGAFMLFDGDGSITIANGENAFMTVGLDLIGFQDETADCLIQIDVKEKALRFEASGNDGASAFHLHSAGPSLLFTADTFTIRTNGAGVDGMDPSSPIQTIFTGHAITLEQVIVLIQSIFATIGVLNPGPLIGATLPAMMVGAINGGILLSPTIAIAPYTAAIQSVLSNPIPPTPALPGVGLSGLLLG